MLPGSSAKGLHVRQLRKELQTQGHVVWTCLTPDRHHPVWCAGSIDSSLHKACKQSLPTLTTRRVWLPNNPKNLTPGAILSDLELPVYQFDWKMPWGRNPSAGLRGRLVPATLDKPAQLNLECCHRIRPNVMKYNRI